MSIQIIEPALPLQGHTLLHTQDLDAAVEAVKFLYSPLRANFSLCRDGGELQINTVDFGETTLIALDQKFSGPCSFFMDACPDSYLLEIPLSGTSRTTINGSSIDARANHTAVLSSPGTPSYWEESGQHYQSISVQFKKESFERRFQLLTGERCKKDIMFNPCIDLRSAAGKSLKSAMFSLFTSLSEPGSIYRHRSSATLFEEFLINALLTSFENTHSAAFGQMAPLTSDQIVTQAEEYFHANSDEPITIGEVASDMGVSVRSLQRTFQIAKGAAPMRRLREIRLDRARERLLSVGPSANVTQIAMLSGFGHMGAFSTYYKKRFDELPSQTVARMKPGQHSLASS